MSKRFSLIVAPHGAFGALATLRYADQPERRFTRQEASILARALGAVADGGSAEKQIYMSPIASDCDFDARVEADGLTIVSAGYADMRLDLEDMSALAQALANW